MKSDRGHEYVDIGFQYYILGRKSALFRFMPVTANIFHHSFEMLLKGKLLSSHKPENLYNTYKHDLPSMWNDFVSLTGAKNASSFNKTVNLLHRWEDIRYPNFPGNKAIGMSLGIRKAPKMRSVGPLAKKQIVFDIILEDMDELFKFTFLNWPLNPDYFKNFLCYGFDSEKMEAYEKDNFHKVW